MKTILWASCSVSRWTEASWWRSNSCEQSPSHPHCPHRTWWPLLHSQPYEIIWTLSKHPMLMAKNKAQTIIVFFSVCFYWLLCFSLSFFSLFLPSFLSSHLSCLVIFIWKPERERSYVDPLHVCDKFPSCYELLSCALNQPEQPVNGSQGWGTLALFLQ